MLCSLISFFGNNAIIKFMIYENMLMNNCEKADISTKNDAGRNKPMLLEIFSLTHVQFFLSATHRFPFEFCLD